MMFRKCMILLMLSSGMTTACNVRSIPEATLTPTNTAVPSVTPTPTPIPTNTPTPTPTSTPTPTPEPTALPTNTPTPEPGNVVTTTLENGWIFYNLKGIGIALPSEWIHLDLNPETFGDALTIASEINPELGSHFTSETLRSLVASGIKFYAIDLNPESIRMGFPASVNILVVDIGMAFPLEQLVMVNLAQIESLADPDIPIHNQRVAISNVKAEELTYAVKMAGMQGESVPVMMRQYLVVDGSVQYVFTLGAPLEMAESYASIFNGIVESIQLNR